MNWFRENRFMGTFPDLVFRCVLAGRHLVLFSAKSDWNDAAVGFGETAAELKSSRASRALSKR